MRPDKERSFVLPFLLSAGLHGLAGLAAWWLIATQPSADSPEMDGIAAWQDEGILTLLEPSGQARSAKASEPSETTNEQEDFVASGSRVDDLPPVPVGEGPTVAAPRVKAPRPGTWETGKGSGSAGPGSGRVSQFPGISRGQSIVYLIDRSLSMGLNGGLAIAKEELLSSLAGLTPAERFQVVFYNRRSEPLRPGLSPADEEGKQAVADRLPSIRAEGSTDHLQALREALRLRPDAIILVTDADDLNPAQVQEVHRLNVGRCPIHAVELSSHLGNAPAGPLTRLAAENAGSYRVVGLVR
jgi:hypothetical protein